MNICVKCRHFKGPVEGTWYDQYCAHPALARIKTVNPVTGKPCYAATNDLGREVFGVNKHPCARDINTSGDCSRFVASRLASSNEAK